MNALCRRVAVITARDRCSALQQIYEVISFADVIELRFDYWSSLNFNEIADLRREITLPVIFTLRKASQGGQGNIPEPQRLCYLQRLAEMAPDYMDLEYDIPVDWLKNFRNDFPPISLIGSYHEFRHTPDNLEQLCQSLMNPLFDIFKIAVWANDIGDALRLLIAIKNLSSLHPVIGIAMGEEGQISRILAPVVGSLLTYGCLDEQTAAAPGQLTLADLTDIYRVHTLNSETEVYALLGDPVSQSPGHLFHNQEFTLRNKNAVYVKCRVSSEKLAVAMKLIHQFPFSGISVTIPHKETILRFVDQALEIAADFQIVNTLKYEQGSYLGFNTDAPAVVECLEKILPLKNKCVLILGSGGSGKALAFALLQQGCEVMLCNRTLSRAQEFVDKFGGKAIDFNGLYQLKEFSLDIVINTLPVHAYLEQCSGWEFPKNQSILAMDIILKPLRTPFIQAAEQAGWRCLTGDKLFIAQALRQLKIWFDM